MKPPAPRLLRKGGLVRVAGGPEDIGAEVRASAFVDVQFDGGSVQRWPGGACTIRELPADPSVLHGWGEAAADEWAFDLMCDVAARFAGVAPRDVDALPCSEVVIEWHADLPRS